MTALWLALPGFLIWLSILLLPWRPWSTRESMDADTGAAAGLSRVTVLIPARNEEKVIERTLRSLQAQGQLAGVILVDDQSDDDTIAAARRVRVDNLRIIEGRPLEEDWSGKLWALEQGREQVRSNCTLLLDADIELKPGTVAALLEKMNREELDMVSLMACLRMRSFWERLLMPAFIFFFKLLYPFSLSNAGTEFVAAAAGGCILIRTEKLADIGGFSALRHALIDDCSLARLVKKSGGRTWTGLTRSVISHRRYDHLSGIWNMVARTAYTQLHCSTGLLLLCSGLMVFAFLVPVIMAFSGSAPATVLSVAALLIMMAIYYPVLRYYDRNPLWAVALPLVGLLYLCMTWSSAWRHWRGTGAIWKDRAYARTAG